MKPICFVVFGELEFRQQSQLLQKVWASGPGGGFNGKSAAARFFEQVTVPSTIFKTRSDVRLG